MLFRCAVFAFVGVLAGCSPKASEPGDLVAEGASPAIAGPGPAAAVVDADAPPADGRERFYGREAFTIVYEQSGVEAGQVTEHVRDYGRNRVEIAKTTTKAAGMSIIKDTRVIYEGAKMTTIDNQTGAITTMTNPLYDGIVASMKGKSAMEFGEQTMRAMGGEKTGEKGSYAGQDCDIWTVSAMSIRSCVTPWGGALYTASSFAGISYERKAVEVRMNDAGPAEAYAFDASKAKEAPDVGAVLKGLPGRN